MTKTLKGALIPGLLALLALAGCSSNPNAIQPKPVPDVKSQYQVDRLWHSGAGDGVGDSDMKLFPAVTEKRVFAADVEGDVYGFNRKTGDQEWHRDTGDRISGGLYAGYGQVIYGTREGKLVALDATDGHKLWSTQLSSEVLAPADSNGVYVVAQTMDGHVVALDPDSGKQLWSYATPVPHLVLLGSSQPVISNGHVYAGFASGKVACLDISSGAPIWEQRLAEPTGRSELDRLVDVDSSLIVQNGGVFTATFQGRVGVMDWDNGQPYWSKKISTHQVISHDLGVLFIATTDGLVRAVDMRSGTFLWQQDKLHGRRLTGTVVQKGLVVVGDYQGYLYWMDPTSGKLVAKYHHDRDGFSAAPVVYDDTLYALSGDGELAAYKIKKDSDD